MRKKRNGIAAALRLFKPKIVPAKKGKKSYKRIKKINMGEVLR